MRTPYLDALIRLSKKATYFDECVNHSLFEPKLAPTNVSSDVTCMACKHQKQCLNDGKGIDKYKIGKKVSHYDGFEMINGKIVECKKEGYFRIQLEKPDNHNSTIIEIVKTFSPYNLTSL